MNLPDTKHCNSPEKGIVVDFWDDYTNQYLRSRENIIDPKRN